MIGLLSNAEPAYVSVKKITSFRERRQNVNPPTSAPFNTQLKAQEIPQEQSEPIQDTPTPDATVIAAQKEKAIQDALAAKNANDWWRTNALALLGSLAGLSGLAAIGVGIWQYNRNQRIDREKREEERFQDAISGLEKEDTKIGAANMLQTFLQKGRTYEKFYRQSFDLSVEYLRKRTVDAPLDPFSQAMIRVFIQSFTLERDRVKKLAPRSSYDPKTLDASDVKLDNAHLGNVDLQEASMPNASFNNAKLYQAHLDKAHLHHTTFIKTELILASMQEAHVRYADFTGARLHGANFTEASLIEANLSQANLKGALFTKADLTNATVQGSNIEWSDDFSGGSMVGVKGLTEEQRNICENIKHANFASQTLDDTTAAYMQQLLGLLMDQLEDRL